MQTPSSCKMADSKTSIPLGLSCVMVEALTFIVRKDPETDMLVTVFEEDQTADPATALFSIRNSSYVALKHFQYILGKLIIVSQKQAMPPMQLIISLVFYQPYLLLKANLRLNIHNECYCCNLYGGYYGDSPSLSLPLGVSSSSILLIRSCDI